MPEYLFSLPIIFLLLAASSLFLKKRESGDLYRQGIREGITMLYNLFPSLLLLCISVKLIMSCGIIEDFTRLIADTPVTEYINAELLPLILTRPISGAGSNAILSELIKTLGPNSAEVFTAAVMMSSSDTCIYIHSTYFAHISKKKNGFLLILMLLTSLISCVLSLFISKKAF